MVLLHVKKADESLFLHEATAATSLAALVPAVARMHNLRLRVLRLVSAGEELVRHGPLKPVEQQGYTEEQLEALAQDGGDADKAAANGSAAVVAVRNGFAFVAAADPTGRRVGEAPGEEAAAIINKALQAASAAASKDLVKSNAVLREDALLEAINIVRGAITIVYPAGLPAWETIQMILDDCEDLEGTAASKEIIPPEDASLWWAGKELVREKNLSDFTGKNDKSKIIVKIQKRGQGPPLREPPVSEQQQKEMMAYYYRKQEQQKKLAENDEDNYLNAGWADTNSLKSTFRGIRDVKWKPF